MLKNSWRRSNFIVVICHTILYFHCFIKHTLYIMTIWCITITYSVAHCSTSCGCVLIAAFVNCFKISGSSGGMLICWAQYIVSGGGITLFAFQDNDKEKVNTKEHKKDISQSEYHSKHAIRKKAQSASFPDQIPSTH